MKTLGLASFAGFVMLYAAQGDEAALKKEQAALQGKWTIVSLETPKGKDENITGATLEFLQDGKIEFTKGDNTKKGAYTLNPAGKPKEITIAPADEDKKFEGIYQIDKNMLKLCVTIDANDGRPAEFAVKEGKSFMLFTMERAK